MITVSVVIPIRNEEENLTHLITLLEQTLRNYSHEFIFVDDGSTDHSRELLVTLQKKYSSLKYFVRKRENKITVGKALKLGLHKACGKYIVVMDGDGSHDPHYIPPLLDQLKKYDLVVASRFIKGGGVVTPFSFKKKICYALFNVVVRSLTKMPIIDFTHGFKVFRRKILSSFTLDSDGFPAYTELAIKALVKGYHLGEYPILYGERLKGTSKFSLSQSFIEYLKLIVWIIKEKWKSLV